MPSSSDSCGDERLTEHMPSKATPPKAGHGDGTAVKLRPSGKGGIVDNHVPADEAGVVFIYICRRRSRDEWRLIFRRFDAENGRKGV